MSYNYSRTYTLTIENAVEISDGGSKEVNNELFSLTATKDLSSITVEGIVITDLQIQASIVFNEKNTGSSGTGTTLSVYNLSQETRDRITNVNGRVIISAGYLGDEKIIFTGQIFKAYTIKNGQDVVTTLECKDGWTPANSIRISKSYQKDTLYADIFEDIIKVFEANGIARSTNGIILGETPMADVTPNELKLIKTWTYSGFARQALDDLCKEFGLTWQIIHSRLFIYPKRYPAMFGFVELDDNNILSIRKRQEGTESTSNSPETTGLEIVTFLNGDIDTSKKINIVQKNQPQGTFDISRYVGEYRVVGVRHVLDFEGESWYTIITCNGDT